MLWIIPTLIILRKVDELGAVRRLRKLLKRKLLNQSNEEQRELLIEAKNKIERYNISVFDQPSDVKALKQECLKGDYDIVIVDYLQKIKPHRNTDRRIIIEEISSELQNLPKQINAPVICISSLTRPDGKDENKPPNMMELKESSNLEFDADVIILMHRKKENGEYQKRCELMCTKNRNGQTGYLKAEVFGSVYKIK
jgi:replicative DNA helicase